KLLYYAQGWHLAVFNAPLFPNRIEAWKHGPVVKDAYAHYQGQFDIKPSLSADPESLSDENKKLVDWVWERYKGLSATALKAKTHREAPWLEAREGLDPDERCENEITPQAMRAFFLPLYAEYLRRYDPRIKKDQWIASANAFAQGQFRKAEDIYRAVLD